MYTCAQSKDCAASGTSGCRAVKRCGEHVDQQQIDPVSQALRDKYGERWPRETQMMLEPPTLPTTLRLQPA